MTTTGFRVAGMGFVLAVVLILIGSPLLRSDEAPPGVAPTSGIQAAERLVIRYSDGQFELVSRHTFEKILPPSVSLPDAPQGIRGSWFEVRDGADNVVYRRLMSSPRLLYSETLAGDGSGQIVRSELPVAEQLFSVLVPANASAQSLALFDQPTDINQRTTSAAAEIGRLTLR